MKYFLGEVEYPNGTKDYRLIEAEDLMKAHSRLEYVVGSFAKNFKVLMTL